MKTDRFFVRRTAAVLLAGLLLAAGLPAAGRSIKIWKLKISFDSSTKELAEALTPQVKEVETRFTENRGALRTVKGSDGKPAYHRQEVADLIAHTGEDLEKAIEEVQPERLEPLSAWVDEEFRHIQEELAALPVKTAAVPSGLSTPRPIAVIASLGSLPMLAGSKPAAPPQNAIPSEKADSLLDQVGKAVGRIFFLAEHNDLEVKLWFGSTPKPSATFSFWPEGKITGSTPAPKILRTNDKQDHVMRGLYAYRASWGQGAAKSEVLEYPLPTGAPVAPVRNERLDLVNDSSFFCCRFNEQYCHHVDNEKQCRP